MYYGNKIFPGSWSASKLVMFLGRFVLVYQCLLELRQIHDPVRSEMDSIVVLNDEQHTFHNQLHCILLHAHNFFIVKVINKHGIHSHTADL